MHSTSGVQRWMRMIAVVGAVYCCLAAAGCVETTRGTYIISSDPPEAYDREAGYSHRPPREPWEF